VTVLSWLSRRLRRSPVGPANRETRRALARLSRPQRHALDRLAMELRRYPTSLVDELLDDLPAWQRTHLEERLR